MCKQSEVEKNFADKARLNSRNKKERILLLIVVAGTSHCETHLAMISFFFFSLSLSEVFLDCFFFSPSVILIFSYTCVCACVRACVCVWMSQVE